VTEPAFSAATARIVEKARAAFLAYGYAEPTMAMLGEWCGLGRRALYYHFHSKEDLYRASLRLRNERDQAAADAVAEQALARGDPPAEAIGDWLDARFGATRRDLLASPHGAELNDVAFRIGSDIMIEVAYDTNRKLAAFVADLCARGSLRLRPGVAAPGAALLLADGARGVNQARPPIPADEIGLRYRAIVDAILFGCAVGPCAPSPGSATPIVTN
jgi:AcrR family transcriptional regulator